MAGCNHLMAAGILVTGATGFVGAALISRLAGEHGYAPVAAVRRDVAFGEGVDVRLCGSLEVETDWSSVMAGVEVVIHCAARAHVLDERATDPLSEFRLVNVEGTIRLAAQAADAGVRRFVFISSIGVLGQQAELPISASSKPDPQEPYAVSKWEAEEALNKLGREAGMEVVVVRPPLVYGPEAPGNFGQLLRWMVRGMPLPLGAVDNRRSLVGLDNLVDLLVTCIDHPAAAGGAFLAGDGEDVSTSELLRRVARAMGRPARLIPVPPTLLRAGARLVGKEGMARRLLDSLQVDISHTRDVLGWEPPISLDEGLQRAVAPLSNHRL